MPQPQPEAARPRAGRASLMTHWHCHVNTIRLAARAHHWQPGRRRRHRHRLPGDSGPGHWQALQGFTVTHHDHHHHAFSCQAL
eukprot:3228457-Rhodomonas_salina.2